MRDDLGKIVQWNAIAISTVSPLFLLNKAFAVFILNGLPLPLLASLGPCYFSLMHQGMYIWRFRERTLSLSINVIIKPLIVLQFTMICLRYDGFILWDWQTIFFPFWILVSFIIGMDAGILFVVIYKIFLFVSDEIEKYECKYWS